MARAFVRHFVYFGSAITCVGHRCEPNLIKENPKLTVQKVANLSGFYSISSFERSFKAMTGKTPRTYLKEVV